MAYLPLGILEWHGLHNPLGLDGIKAERVLTYLAGKLGGVVLPPLFWGDNRAEIVDVVCDSAVSAFPPPAMGDHVTKICEIMGLARSRLDQEARRSTANGGWRLWEKLLIHMLFQSEALGFELVVVYPGHYPMHGPLHRAIEGFKVQGGRTAVFALTDHLAGHGDHAGAFETSLLLALAPDLVDLSELSADGSMHIGVVGEDPIKNATPERGWLIVEKFQRIVEEQIRKLGRRASG